MTITDNKIQQQDLVIRYLYSDMSADEVISFEQELKVNSELKQILTSEQQLNQVFLSGSQPYIEPERLQGNRWLLQQKLQKEKRQDFSFNKWTQALFGNPLALTLQAFLLVAAFMLGLTLSAPAALENAVPTTSQSPLALINADDFEIFQFNVRQFNPLTGEIDLGFSLAAETHLSGNVADAKISGLMATALQDNINSASRLDTINALQTIVASNTEVYQALIYALSNDRNPGVRYQAVQALVLLSHEEQVRNALRLALSEDANQGVRVEAFQALRNYPEPETLAVFRQKMDTDSNEFIRSQARIIVEDSETDTITL